MILVCGCGQRVKASGARPGRIGRCPSCGSPLEVPHEPTTSHPEVISATGRLAVLSSQETGEIEDESQTAGGYFVEPVQRMGAGQGGKRQRRAASPSSPRKLASGYIAEPQGRAHEPMADGLLPLLSHPETSVLALILYPLRGAETLAMVAVMGVTLWGFATLVPEYCLGVWADASTLGTPSMGMLVILISAIPALLLLPLIVIYMLQYLGRVLVSSAMGDTSPPRTPDRNFDGLFSGLYPWLTWLIFGGLISLFPLALLAFLEDQPILEKPLLVVGLMTLGLPYAMTSLMMSFLHDHPLAAAPPGVICALLRHGRSFFPTLFQSSALVALGGGAFALTLALRTSHFWLYLALMLGCWELAVWIAIVTMRVLGLHYHRHRAQLDWQRADPRWGVSWRL